MRALEWKSAFTENSLRIRGSDLTSVLLCVVSLCWRLSGEAFKLIHCRDAEHAEVAPRDSNLRYYQTGGGHLSAVTLDLDEHPSEEDLRQVLDGVRIYNRSISGHGPPRAVASFLRDDEGRIVGGAHGELWGRSVHIAAMWVAESQRGQGHGSALLTAVEDYAATNGATLSYLETTSFQARPFYESLGYRVFGELVGIDEGVTLFFLRKDLQAPIL
jgi:GNAT superfamily N-acetyltransferase